jgi:hypothetical protein
MSCGKSRSRETPQAQSAEEAPDRPRKASAWSGNQQASLTEPFYKKEQTMKKLGDFYKF